MERLMQDRNSMEEILEKGLVFKDFLTILVHTYSLLNT